MKSKEFIDQRTGEIVTQVPLTQIAHFAERTIYGGYGHDGLGTYDAELSDYFNETNHPGGTYGADRLEQFIEINEETYWYFLEVLPPLYMRGGAFLLSEALTETATGTVYHYFLERGGRFFHKYVEVSHADNETLEASL